MPRSTRPLHLAWVSLAALGLLACRTPSSKIPLEQLAADEQQPTRGEAREAVAPLPVERPTDLLPPEVAVVAEAIRPTALLDLLGPLDKYPELDSFRAQLRDQLGGDIFDANQWAQLGLASDGPAGVGILDIPSETFFFYLSLTDPTQFDQTLQRAIDMVGRRNDYAASEVAGARVYRLARGLNVVVRDRIALLLVSDDEAPRDYVVTAATIDPRESLSHSQKFVWARQQLQASDDGMLFINPPELLQQIERDRSSGYDYGLRYAEDELARARSAGEPAEVIRQLEARVEEERRWQRERDARSAGKRELVQSVIGPVAAFVGAADLRDDGIVAHARASMPSSSLLRRLFLPPEHESPLLSALDEPPLFAVDGRIDLQVLLELLELLARSDGHTLDSINREIRAETGIDMLTGVIPALTGEGGLMLTEAGKPDPKRLAEVRKSVGLAGYAGLQAPDTIRKLLDGIARDKLLAGMLVRAKRGDGWVLRVPNWRDVNLTIVGDRLVVSSDSKLAARIQNAERGAQADVLAATEHPLRGPLASPAVRMYWHMLGFVLLDAREPWKQDAESMFYDINTHHALTPDQAAKVPRSREYKRKLAELQKAIDEIDAHSLRRAQQSFQRQLDFAAELGDLGLQIEPVADGLAFAGSWRFAKGTTPVELGATFVRMSGADDYDWAEYDRLNMLISERLNELRAIRQADLDAAAAKRPSK